MVTTSGLIIATMLAAKPAMVPAVDAPSVISLPAGNGYVIFPHAAHVQAQKMACVGCHGDGAPGRIANVGRDVAHAWCHGCHKSMNRGPVRCADCHAKNSAAVSPQPPGNRASEAAKGDRRLQARDEGEENLFLQLPNPLAVLSMVGKSLADPIGPVVTEFNWDALIHDGSRFPSIQLKPNAGWHLWTSPDGLGRAQFRVKRDGNRYEVEFQSNAGGTFTSQETFDFVVERRDIRVGGGVKSVRVLRVEGYHSEDD